VFGSKKEREKSEIVVRVKRKKRDESIEERTRETAA